MDSKKNLSEKVVRHWDALAQEGDGDSIPGGVKSHGVMALTDMVGMDCS